MFNEFDVDHNGIVNVDELTHIYAKVGYHKPWKKARDIMNKFHGSHPNELTLKEFLDGFMNSSKK